MIYLGDLFDVLPTLDAESIDACVTDPPYGIGFMGKKWDTFHPTNISPIVPNATIDSDNPNLKGRHRSPASSPSGIIYNRELEGQREFQAWTEQWAREVYRVLKPGSHILVCGAPRSFHRMTSGLEDAGFVVRDCFSWLYGSGFPKSLDISKTIDKAEGVWRGRAGAPIVSDIKRSFGQHYEQSDKGNPVTSKAIAWAGWGTGLKPAWEPIILARKPLVDTLAVNVEMFGTGGLNIDACRIEGIKPLMTFIESDQRTHLIFHTKSATNIGTTDIGRWPPNVLLDEEAAEMLDEQTGDLGGGSGIINPSVRRGGQSANFAMIRGNTTAYKDTGGASRFFYVAKPSRTERDEGCYDLPQRSAGEATNRVDDTDGLSSPRAGAGRTGGARNIHPTTKPVTLMQWLITLITPPNGIVLDSFMGSGTTGMAARHADRQFIGIERETEYVEIARRRISEINELLYGEEQVKL